MKTIAKSLRRLIYTVAGISLASLLLPQSSWAQTAPTDRVEPLREFNQGEQRDPFSQRYDGDDSFGGVFDLMHRAQMGSIRNPSEFSDEQNQNIDAAASQFRQLQRQRIQQAQPQQATPNTPVDSPQ